MYFFIYDDDDDDNNCSYCHYCYHCVAEYFDKIDCDLKRGGEEDQLLDAVKKRRTFGEKTPFLHMHYTLHMYCSSYMYHST